MYSARITRDNPAAFIFLIDQSGSMEEKMASGPVITTKAEVVAEVTNLLLREIVNRCRKEDGVADYFDIAAIGYSGEQASMLLSKEMFVTPSALNMAHCRKRTITRERLVMDGGTRLTTDNLNYWIEPRAQGNTPMRAALEQALWLVERWCRKPGREGCYPPTLINITDGEATDADHEDLTSVAEEIKSAGTNDGKALLININISSSFSDHTILFPTSREELPGSRYSETLFDMSSVMPETYNEHILRLRPGTHPPFRGMSLNTSAADLVAMMNIGSLSIGKML